MRFNLYEELEGCYRKHWADVNDIVIFPYTVFGRRLIKEIKKIANVLCFIDNNSLLNGTEYNDIVIYSAQEWLKNNKNKILISNHYKEVSEQLIDQGFVENIDFMDIKEFISLRYWIDYKKLWLYETHMAITTYCSLNCRNCNMFINHYKQTEKKYYSVDDIINNIKLYFINVDYCDKFVILGGEPLLHTQLIDIIRFIYDNYSDKIRELNIITNGTIIPGEELLCEIVRTGTTISVSDYSLSSHYTKKIDKLMEVLDGNNIQYNVSQDLIWKDFFFPNREVPFDISNVKKHMDSCAPVFRGLNDGKFYFCHIAWSAENIHKYRCREDEYVVLTNKRQKEKALEIMKVNLGYLKRGGMDLCKVCGGCGEDNSFMVNAGVQDERY